MYIIMFKAVHDIEWSNQNKNVNIDECLFASNGGLAEMDF